MKYFLKEDRNLQTLQVKEILSFKEALSFLDLSSSFLYKLTSNRKIRFTKPNGGKIYFRKMDLENWMLQNEVKSTKVLEDELTQKIKGNGKGSK